MKRIILLFSITITVSFTSCSSDDDQATQIQEDNFYALTIGNSWVYKNYRRNTDTDNYDYIGVIDSVSIVGTEIVNGNEYFKFRRKTTGNEVGYPLCHSNGIYFELLRDSLGYLVRDDGKIKYANNDFSERDLSWSLSFGFLYEKLQEDNQIVNVEAGIFDCLDTERYVIHNDGQQLPGLDHYYYSKGVGFIFSTLSFVSSPHHSFERRLDSYNIQ